MPRPGRPAPADGQLVTYTFDQVAIATVKITTAAGEQAARQAAAALQSISVQATSDELEYLGDIAPGTVFDPAYISPRVPAYLADAADAAGNPVQVSSTELFAEPISGDARRDLARLVTAWRAAADAPSANGEHAAAAELADAVSALLDPRPLHTAARAVDRDFPLAAAPAAPGRAAAARRRGPAGGTRRRGRTQG